MFIYFLFIRLAALFGHRKARLMVEGQKDIRLAMSDERLAAFKGAIWIHVSSVGEFEQARPLIESLKVKGERLKIVLTFFSPSGYELRKNYDKADAVYYLPFATRRNAKRFLDALQPSKAIFVKYEFWPAYLRELKKRNISTYNISAIFRENQLFFRPWGKWYLNLLRCFTHIFVQDGPSRALLAKHGITNVSITGDTRFDRVKAVMENGLGANNERLAPIQHFTAGCEQVIVAGSTWPKDEELLVRYLNKHPNTKLVLVPHEIDEEHLHFIFNLFQGRFVRYSRATQTSLIHANVLVIDTIGLLSSIYRFGQVAYIGGGFGVGIHNTIEAAVYGVPVIFGPNYLHFREAKGLIAASGARSIRNYEELEAALTTALEQHETIGAKSAEYVDSELGATEKIYKAIF
ncbi:MAG: 3-deoxy-D-manno-octulosonic acid transferase [Paludibacteraceae bacterium]|nr:3-deoxy-D-manno-octulosonic acid transferase [Paludibacteraceae bacterium]